MAAVPTSKLSEQEIAQLACTYASLLLHDDGIEITDKAINKVLKASGLKVQTFWPTLFAKSLQGRNVSELLSAFTTPAGGSSGQAQSNQSQSSAPQQKKEEPKAQAKKEEKVEEPVEEDFDMGDLFG